MQVGVIFPQTELEADAGAFREYAVAVEEMGFSHISAYDHVLGANTASRPDWKGPYRLETPFQEPLMLFSHMAAVTSRIGFFTAILILPQRQTALVAKQAACLDVFCDGRLRLGVGTGWNEVEYEALGMSYPQRGRHIEEQIEVLCALWSQDAVSFDSEFHTINDAGINPLPVQRPIPIWLGGGSDRPMFGARANEKVIRRIARLADGWCPMWQPGPRAEELMELFRSYCREYGRNPDEIGLEGSYVAARSEQERWFEGLSAWRDMGASHVSIITMNEGLKGVKQHLQQLPGTHRIGPVQKRILIQSPM